LEIMPATLSQLELDLFAARGTRPPRVVVTRALRSHRSCNRVLERVDYVRRFFPELDDVTLKVGLTRAASGMAVPGGVEIWLNPGRPSFHTIAHEMVHLLQKRGLDVPQGERSCDVFSLARDWTLNDVSPSYVRVPPALLLPDGSLRPEGARLVHRVAADAVAMRRGGLRTYIAWFEGRLQEMVDARHRRTTARPTDLS
jgi:hypothetical protein